LKSDRTFIHTPVSLGYENLGDASVPGTRIYVTPAGKHYPSITTVLGSVIKEGIETWKAAVGEQEASRVLHHAGTRGTALHLIAEKYLNNETDIFEPNTMPHIKALWRSIKPLLDANVGKVVLQECPLYSDIFGVAGRVDCIAEYEGTLSVIDFKTSRQRKTKDYISNYFMQAAFYAAAFYERTNIPITQSVILMAVDDDPNPIVFKENTYKWLKDLKRVIKTYNETTFN
jgi:genome maintenance exonuclease 1